MDIKAFDEIISENKILSIIFNDEFRNAMVHANNWEKKHKYYKENYCLKPMNNAVKKNTIETSIQNLVRACQNKDINIEYKSVETIIDTIDIKTRCILPINHTGRCTKTLRIKSILNPKYHKILSQLDWVYSTPGNNDFIFKNRSSRIFPIKLSDKVESKIRDKNKKFKCAIPLKDGSTPLMAATCYIDLVSCFLNIKGVITNLSLNKLSKKLINIYKKNHYKWLKKQYHKINRNIGNKYSLACPIRGLTFVIDDLLLPREHDNSIQFGHVHPRHTSKMQSRGLNVLFMSRRGNLILGDNSFKGNKWINDLLTTLDFNFYTCFEK